jgi:hypothetical protein
VVCGIVVGFQTIYVNPFQLLKFPSYTTFDIGGVLLMCFKQVVNKSFKICMEIEKAKSGPRTRMVAAAVDLCEVAHSSNLTTSLLRAGSFAFRPIHRIFDAQTDPRL